MADLSARLTERREAGLYRQRRVVEGAQGPEIVVDGRPMLGFCSNDYLGLAADPRLADAMRRGLEVHGTGAGAAHLVSGHTRAHHDLEDALAAHTGRARALLFSTGYMANMGVLGALLGRGDALLGDRLNHASLVDGGRLSGARMQRYAHADVGALGTRLAGARGQIVVATDGVFSMDGDVAPLAGLAAAAAAHDALLVVDDAHGIGVLGERGEGSVAVAGLGQDDVPVYMATLGKALGVSGAFVAGSDDLIEYLVQFARPYVYTTAMPPALATAAHTALAIAREETWRRERLDALVARFRSGAEQLGLDLMPSSTPIQPLLLGDSRRATAWSQALAEQGIWVAAIREPTVPRGEARLRVTLSAAHREAQVDRLLDALDRIARSRAA